MSTAPDTAEIQHILEDIRPKAFSQYPLWRMKQFTKAFKKGRYTYIGDLRKDNKWHSWTKRKNDVPDDVVAAMIGVANGDAVELTDRTVNARGKINRTIRGEIKLADIKIISGIDENSDGSLSQAEMDAWLNRNSGKPGAKPTPKPRAKKPKEVLPDDCKECGVNIPEGLGITTKEGRYHAEHFVCRGCKKRFSAVDKDGDGVIDAEESAYQVKRGYNVCDSKCAKLAFCAMCDQDLGDVSVGFQGGKYHGDCLTCEGCTKPVWRDLDGDGVVDADEVKFGVKQGHVVHDAKCAAMIFCGHCDQFAGDGAEIAQHNGYVYHAECFLCTDCEGPLPNGEFATIDAYPDQRFCSKCAAQVV